MLEGLLLAKKEGGMKSSLPAMLDRLGVSGECTETEVNSLLSTEDCSIG